jgi:hypothetical protein
MGVGTGEPCVTGLEVINHYRRQERSSCTRARRAGARCPATCGCEWEVSNLTLALSAGTRRSDWMRSALRWSVQRDHLRRRAYCPKKSCRAGSNTGRTGRARNGPHAQGERDRILLRRAALPPHTGLSRFCGFCGQLAHTDYAPRQEVARV